MIVKTLSVDRYKDAKIFEAIESVGDCSFITVKSIDTVWLDVMGLHEALFAYCRCANHLTADGVVMRDRLVTLNEMITMHGEIEAL